MKKEKLKYDILVGQLLKGKTWEQRALAATYLSNFKDDKTANHLINALKTENDPGVRQRIIEALGKIRSPMATRPLLELLKEELKNDKLNKTSLFIIIESLFKIGDKKALIELGLLQASCKAEIKQFTEDAIHCIDPNWKKQINNSNNMN
ncbi:MAG: HEAT repeat domain-containing protein [Promethearchaeota archaeon]